MDDMKYRIKKMELDIERGWDEFISHIISLQDLEFDPEGLKKANLLFQEKDELDSRITIYDDRIFIDGKFAASQNEVDTYEKMKAWIDLFMEHYDVNFMSRVICKIERTFIQNRGADEQTTYRDS